MPVQKSTPVKTAQMTKCKSTDYDAPKSLIHSLLTPQNTPGEFMQDSVSPFDADQETQGYSPVEGNTPARMSDMLRISNHQL